MPKLLSSLLFTSAAISSISFLSLGCSSTPEDDADQETTAESALVLEGYVEPTEDDLRDVFTRYAHLDPESVVPRVLLAKAVAFRDLNADRVDNKRYVSVIDFAQHSSKKRFFVVDTDTGEVEAHVVAHGSGSDPNHSGIPRRFSNVPGSNASSVGYYLAAETYRGRNGLSMRLDGLSDTNTKARARAVVIHGAAYVENGRSLQGRSWGCPALPDEEAGEVIRKIKGNSVLYAEGAR